MTYHLLDKCEQALASVLTSPVGSLASIYTGKDDADKSLPCVICLADGEAEGDPLGTGNFWIQCTVSIRYFAQPNPDGTVPADAPLTSMATLADAVSGVIQDDTLPSLLSAAVTDFHVFGVVRGAPSYGRDENGAWIDEIPIRLYCCASDF